MLLLSLLVVALCPHAHARDHFAVWAQAHGRMYLTSDEFSFRQRVFVSSKALVSAHNAKLNQQYTLGLNAFSDLTFDEFAAAHLGLLPTDSSSLSRGLRGYPHAEEPEVAPVDCTEDRWRGRSLVSVDGGSTGRVLVAASRSSSRTASRTKTSTKSTTVTASASKAPSTSGSSTKSASVTRSTTKQKSGKSASVTGSTTKSTSGIGSMTKSASVTRSTTRTVSLTGTRSSSGTRSTSVSSQPTPTLYPPTADAWDWGSVNDVSYLSPVKYQGRCGSCWAFVVTGALESAMAIAGRPMQQLSEQQLVDCTGASTKYELAGCSGGLMEPAFQYLIDTGGSCSSLDYPYLEVDGVCRACTPVVQVASFVRIPRKSEPGLRSAVVQQPVAVIMKASPDFQHYASGIFTGVCGTIPDHAVLVVGFGVDALSGGLGYWRVKNQWGESWGERGYMRLVRDPTINGGQGQCGILAMPSYPVLSG